MDKQMNGKRTSVFEAVVTTALFAAIIVTAGATWSLAAAWPG